MNQKYEWDFPVTMRPRKQRRVEVLPPADEPKRVRVEIEVRHHQRRSPNPQSIIVALAIAFAAIMVLRFPLGLVLLPALVGRDVMLTGVFLVAVLAVAGWWHRWRGRF